MDLAPQSLKTLALRLPALTQDAAGRPRVDYRAVLALAAGLFTAFLEAAWLWAYHDYEPSGTLGNNFTLDLGLSPAWRVLLLGLLAALVAAGRQVFGPARLDPRKAG